VRRKRKKKLFKSLWPTSFYGDKNQSKPELICINGIKEEAEKGLRRRIWDSEDENSGSVQCFKLITAHLLSVACVTSVKAALVALLKGDLLSRRILCLKVGLCVSKQPKERD
jgi:hypothetical protein